MVSSVTQLAHKPYLEIQLPSTSVQHLFFRCSLIYLKTHENSVLLHNKVEASAHPDTQRFTRAHSTLKFLDFIAAVADWWSLLLDFLPTVFRAPLLPLTVLYVCLVVKQKKNSVRICDCGWRRVNNKYIVLSLYHFQLSTFKKGLVHNWLIITFCFIHFLQNIPNVLVSRLYIMLQLITEPWFKCTQYIWAYYSLLCNK